MSSTSFKTFPTLSVNHSFQGDSHNVTIAILSAMSNEESVINSFANFTEKQQTTKF